MLRSSLFALLLLGLTETSLAYGVEGCKGRKDPYDGKPPAPAGMQREASHLVRLKTKVPDLRLHLAYGTAENVMGRAFYPKDADCLVLPSLAQALVRAAAALRQQGYGLIAYDCYRPWRVQVALWKACPKRGLVADPARGSKHNLGAAIDVGLYHLKTGKKALMPSEFDDLSRRSRHNYMDAPKEALRHRRRLAQAMTGAKLRAIGSEWWHYELRRARARYPVLDAPLPSAAQ